MMTLISAAMAAFGAALGDSLPRSVVEAIFKSIYKSQLRKVWRRSIRDMAEDMVFEALVDYDIPVEEAKDYIGKRKKMYKQEARNRFDHALQERR